MKYEIYSGAGNTFVMINNLNWSNEIPLYKQDEFAEVICRELFKEIDGVIFADRPVTHGSDVRMNYYNRDGSFGAMCGNGSRCLAMYLFKNGIVNSKEILLEAVNDIYKAEIIDDDSVKITFPDPKHFRFNVTLKAEIGGVFKELGVSYADVGSDHLVLFLDDENNKAVLGGCSIEEIDVNTIGAELRNHFEFQPRGANVNFVKPVKGSEIRIRTYERGVERETLACGTGVISSAIIYALDRSAKPPVTVQVESGEKLMVDFKLSSGKISELSLTGSAKKIGEGEF
ncbi:MAG: diaminopimelate epimerase [Ignavibacteria bacterium]|nr:diaminopimelate epimerase [Ignavibacteria bacterium]